MLILRVVALAFSTVAGLGSPARSEIHDYMILRMLYLGTTCGVQKLERLDAGRPDWRRFKAECRDVSSYPHGLFVICTDPDDDRHCRAETTAREFDSLELLRPKGE